jgi:hypothetical protein
MRKIALIVLIGMMMAGIAWAKDATVPTRDEVVSFVKEAVVFTKENGKEAALKELKNLLNWPKVTAAGSITPGRIRCTTMPLNRRPDMS